MRSFWKSRWRWAGAMAAADSAPGSRWVVILFLGAALLAASAPWATGQCERAKLRADDGAADDKFSFSVAVSSNIAVIGAPFDDDHGINSGSAHLFTRNGTDWSMVDKLTRENAGEGDGFGWSVAIAGDIAVFGVLGEALACVFESSGGAWSQITELTANDGWLGDFFGQSVALSSNLALVGAPHDDDNDYRSGSLYIFERDPNGVWSQAAKLLATDGEPYDRLGTAVAISGNVAIAGAPYDQDLGVYAGSAYAFERDPNGFWSQVDKLLPEDGAGFWDFGSSVAVSGDFALVGAPGAEGPPGLSGAAYVFERQPNGTWPQAAKLAAADGGPTDRFGESVALSANVAVIGAWSDDDLGTQSGTSYVFVRQPEGSWSQVAKLLADDGAAYDQFGNAVAVSGNTAVIGAYYDDDHGEDSGSAYIFAVGPDEDGDGIMDVCLCPGDLDGDLDIDLSDLAQLLSNYGATSGAVYEDGDLDEDGDVDLADLAALLSVYGTICP